MSVAPATIFSIWTLAGVAYLWLCFHRLKRRRRMARSLQMAVRQHLRAA